MLTLNEIQSGESVLIKRVRGRSNFRRRIIEMGFVCGKEVLVVKNAPFKDPIEYRILDYNISLRRSEAALIEVVPLSEAENLESDYNGTLQFEKSNQNEELARGTIKLAFVGNPNAGKTSLFNVITGKQEHVGNYSGVTVDAKRAKIKHKNYRLDVTDLPGTYSLSPNSPEELYVRDHILKEHPDVVINIVDASNLERNLYLTCQLIDMDVPVVMALNMYDQLEKKGDTFDHETFAKITGIPVVPTVGMKKWGTTQLIEKAIEVHENKEPSARHIHINYGTELEQSINKIQSTIWKADNYVREFSSRHIALRLLQSDEHTFEAMHIYTNGDEIRERAYKEIQRLENLLKEDAQTLVTNARYGFIRGALKETFKANLVQKKSSSGKIDRILTGKYSGFPIFLLVLWIMFQGTFTLGKFPANWIELGVQWLGHFAGQALKPGPVHDLLIDGVIGGVGGVLVFLPNIVILFFFISLMEDTGYMSRVAFIMDKLMHLIGLHGKSFIPLIMGFGCNVPAIMSTRTLENRSDRLLTMLIVPFMSCSARLPVYILIAGAVFPHKAGTIIFMLYLTGIAISILTALLLKKSLLKKAEAPFVMELPPYRIPTLRSALRHMWFKAREYLKKMGGIILWASVLVWFLGYYPRTNQRIVQLEKQKTELSSEADLKLLDAQITLEQQSNSYLGKIGKGIEPVIRPLGFDWKIGISLITGIVAKEIVVSTLGVIYTDNNPNDDINSLPELMQQETHLRGKLKGQKVYSPAASLALMVFVLIYVPCIAVIAAIKKESGKWKYSLWSVGYGTAVAYTLAFIVFRVATYLG